MNFSIILASRERVSLLEGFLQSILDTTADISNVEVLIGIDTDDEVTKNAAIELERRFPFAFFHIRKRSKNLNNDYLNWLYKKFSKGKFLIACNDDAAFRTKNWDQIALGKLEAYLSNKSDGICYGFISDALEKRAGGMQYCCFPLFSRKSCDALGWMLPGRFNGWNADIAAWRVYKTIDRICDLSEIEIEHISYHTGRRERDKISFRMEEISAENENGADYDITRDVNRLSGLIGKLAGLPEGKNGIVYSIVLASRERVDLLNSLVASIDLMTVDKAAIEVVVAYDLDDRQMNVNIPKLVRKYGRMIKFYGRRRSDWINRDYINWAVKFSKGTFVIPVNDDCEFKTYGWDQILTSKLKIYFSKRPDWLVYCKTNDGMGNRPFSSFPVISRQAVDVLGYCMHPDHPSLQADARLWRVMTTIDRILDIPEILIDHISYHTGKRGKDHINQRIENLHSKNPIDPMACEVMTDFLKLKAHIDANPYVPVIEFQEEKVKPHILFVTERWCDGNPAAGLTNNEHNLFGSLQSTEIATFERWHIDEYRARNGKIIDDELLMYVKSRRSKIDVIFLTYLFCSDMNLKHETIKELHSLGIPLVFMWFDAVLEPRMAFADEWAAPYSSLNIVLDTSNYKTKYPEKYISMWTPQDTRYFYDGHIERDIDVCFLGSMNGYPDRNLCINAIKLAGIEVFQAGGQRERNLPLEAYVNILQRSKICLSFPRMRGQNLIQAKGRIFEATMCGCLLMDAENDQTKRWFEPMEEYVSFSNEIDLVAKIRFYLENRHERERIAKNGWLKSSTRYNSRNFWTSILEKCYEKA